MNKLSILRYNIKYKADNDVLAKSENTVMLSETPLLTTIPVKDMEQAIEFYGQVLGLDIIDEDETGVWFRAGNTRFALYETEQAGKSRTPAAIWLVHEPKKLVALLQKRGIKFIEKNKEGKKIVTNGKFMRYKNIKAACFRDPSGNIICIAGYT